MMRWRVHTEHTVEMGMLGGWQGCHQLGKLVPLTIMRVGQSPMACKVTNCYQPWISEFLIDGWQLGVTIATVCFNFLKRQDLVRVHLFGFYEFKSLDLGNYIPWDWRKSKCHLTATEISEGWWFMGVASEEMIWRSGLIIRKGEKWESWKIQIFYLKADSF